MKNKKFKIITLGCKVNQYESAALEECLVSGGWAPALQGDIPDCTVINTCIVTGRASYQSRQAVRKAVRENSGSFIAVVGCYPQVFPEEIEEIEGVDIILGNCEKSMIPDILKRHIESREKIIEIKDFKKEIPFDFVSVKNFSGRTRAFLKIQDGCRSFCSYCIVPYSRGPLRSLAPDWVIDSLKEFSKMGYREVVFTGIHLGKYGVDLGADQGLEKLLVQAEKEISGMRIRLSSLEPMEITPGLIDMAAEKEWLCRHFHIPLQSGDRGVLTKMNRHYSPKDFYRLVESIHEKIPMAAIGVDVIAGFPQEDEKAFSNTCSLIKDLPVSYLHVFPFSARKGTPAAEFSGQLKSDVIRERAALLRKIGKEKRMEFYRSSLNKNFTVLAEGCESKEKGIMKGLSDNYLPVFFHSNKSGKNEFVNVTIEKTTRDGVVGRVISI